MADKIPQLGSSVKGVSEVYDMIKNPEYVRPTTRIANLQRAIDRGTESKVVRSAGYNRLFQTFLKHGISSATVNKFKLIPDIANFDSAKAYSEALKKFRNTAFKGLSNAQLRVIESSGFLSQYAKDQRIKLLKSGLKNVKPNLNKIMDQLFDFTFMTEKSAAGVAKPKLQSKIYTQIRDMAKSTLNKAQRLNLDYALSQVDDLFKSGKVAKAAKMLAGISTMVAKGAFGKVIPGLSNLITTEMGSGELTPEIIEEFKKDQAQDRMNKRGGGIMDINHMTRPLGYALGTQAGELVGDREKYLTEQERMFDYLAGIEKRLSQARDLTEHEAGPLRRERQRILDMLFGRDTLLDPITKSEMDRYRLSPGQSLYDEEGNLITESPRGQVSDFEKEQILKLMPGQKAYDAEGNVVTEDQLPYDRDKGYTENLNELMTDIGGTIKEKVKGAGKSLRDKINDFMKYGWGDREDYMEIGGEQMDSDDPNFRRFIEENYMGEGESYIEGIENYRREVESGAIGEGFRRGGIVSLNHMTRPL